MKSAQFGGQEVLEKVLQLQNANFGGRLESSSAPPPRNWKAQSSKTTNLWLERRCVSRPIPRRLITTFDEAILGRIKRGIIRSQALPQGGIR